MGIVYKGERDRLVTVKFLSSLVYSSCFNKEMFMLWILCFLFLLFPLFSCKAIIKSSLVNQNIPFCYCVQTAN